MSIGRCKDIDYEICKYLDDGTVLSLSKINRYYYNILNREIFWKRRFFSFLKEMGKGSSYPYNSSNYSWKKYYFFIKKWISNPEIVRIGIEKDCPDLLYISFPHPKIEEEISPYNCIEKDSIKCFKFLYEFEEKKDLDLYIKLSINKKSIKILNHLLSLSGKLNSDIIISIIEKNIHECIKFLQLDFQNFFHTLSFEKKLIEEMLVRKNIAFSLLIQKLTYEEILNYKHKFNISKLLTVYTSPFSAFSYSPS